MNPLRPDLRYRVLKRWYDVFCHINTTMAPTSTDVVIQNRGGSRREDDVIPIQYLKFDNYIHRHREVKNVRQRAAEKY